MAARPLSSSVNCMPIRDTLSSVLTRYPNAVLEAFAKHPVASFLRQDARIDLEVALGTNGTGLIVEGSAGAGNWAAVPWISIFDPAVTTSATRGYYVVYLFHANQPVVHLSLNQGTTAVRSEFNARAREILKDRAEFMRKRLADFGAALPIKEIELGSDARLPGDYAAGHSLGVSYQLATLPNEDELLRDLHAIVRAYRALTFRGGLDPDASGENIAAKEFGVDGEKSITETRKYAYHRKIERNGTAANLAKKFHGTRCQGCNFEFSEKYGHLGKGYIEAHHLRPISSLEEGVPVSYDLETDFAVLCSNCHRMIHRTADPSDLTSFRSLIHSIGLLLATD